MKTSAPKDSYAALPLQGLSRADAEKKERERRIIEAARTRSAYFPPGELVPVPPREEPPDWLIPSARLGIEVSEILPARQAGANFSGPQLSSFQEGIVTAAEKHYYSSIEALPADVLVYFRNEWSHQRDKNQKNQMAKALANFVRSNYPPGEKDCITLEPTRLSHGGHDWIEGTVVRIARGRGTWQAPGCTGIEFLTYEELAESISRKDERLLEYRRRCPGWQMWLLLSTRMRVLESVSVPGEVTTWRFKSDFDKVLLFPWDDGVIELQLG